MWVHLAFRDFLFTHHIRLISQRGPIGENWWSCAWRRLLERKSHPRLIIEGKRLARSGKVKYPKEGEGKNIVFPVEEKREEFFYVTLRRHNALEEDEISFFQEVTKSGILTASLASGIFIEEMRELFRRWEDRLLWIWENLPYIECDCNKIRDNEKYCAHIMAVGYVVTEAFDRTPWLALEWSGIRFEKFYQILVQKWGGDPSSVRVKDKDRERNLHSWLEEQKINQFYQFKPQFWQISERQPQQFPFFEPLYRTRIPFFLPSELRIQLKYIYHRLGWDKLERSVMKEDVPTDSSECGENENL